ncbi:flagellar assembly protein FliH [Psychromonas sp.]|nr:flagellar assembly protein FliH [Psychromonas sp.]
MAVDNDQDFQQWVLPDFDNDLPKEQDETNLFGKPANWYNNQERDSLDPEDEKPKPLTLEDIESIRASAYEDGFNEGKEAGFVKGLEEGKLQGLSEGHREGLAQGLDQGLSEGQAKIDAQTLHWQQLVSRLNRPLEKLDDNVEFQLIKLATSLAEQITRCEVTVNPQIILQALKQGVEALPVNEQTIVISLHPEDLIFIQNAFPEAECAKRGWDLRSEPTLLRGDCQVQTQTSSIDYTFSTRVQQVLKHFLKENFQNTPDVSDDGDINNDTDVDYEMVSESDLQERNALQKNDKDLAETIEATDSEGGEAQSEIKVIANDANNEKESKNNPDTVVN